MILRSGTDVGKRIYLYPKKRWLILRIRDGEQTLLRCLSCKYGITITDEGYYTGVCTKKGSSFSESTCYEEAEVVVLKRIESKGW